MATGPRVAEYEPAGPGGGPAGSDADVGRFTDGWAHTNRPGLESFFTPWHALLYSGFAVTVAWTAWLAAAPFRQHRRREVQVPHGLSVLGAAVFGVGGLGDMMWHTAFGVEFGLEVLLSPPIWFCSPGSAAADRPSARRRAADRAADAAAVG